MRTRARGSSKNPQRDALVVELYSLYRHRHPTRKQIAYACSVALRTKVSTFVVGQVFREFGLSSRQSGRRSLEVKVGTRRLRRIVEAVINGKMSCMAAARECGCSQAGLQYRIDKRKEEPCEE